MLLDLQPAVSHLQGKIPQARLIPYNMPCNQACQVHTWLAIKLAEKSPGFQLNVISHLQVAARHTSFSHFFVLFTKKN